LKNIEEVVENSNTRIVEKRQPQIVIPPTTPKPGDPCQGTGEGDE
jgi:hypothetical protein